MKTLTKYIIGISIVIIIVAIILYFILRPTSNCKIGQGSSCEVNNDCKNGGSCFKNANNFCHCKCVNGFTGPQCETSPPICRSGPCQNSPCENGGTCKENNGICTCQCINGFTGTNCQTPQQCTNERCPTAPCQGRSICKYVNGACKCQSPCTNELCPDIPCQNGGICQENDGVCTSCFCINGYTGSHCQTPP